MSTNSPSLSDSINTSKSIKSSNLKLPLNNDFILDHKDKLHFTLSKHINKDIQLNIPPVKMWGWSEKEFVSGYCGETGFQSALKYYGNYVSAEYCRMADGNVELLIGVNDVKAAKALHLKFESFNTKKFKKPQAKEFDTWCCKQLNDGCPVLVGFYQRKPEGEGELEYDHIMIIIGYTHDKDGDLQYYFNDFWKESISVTEHCHSARNNWTCKDEPEQPFEYSLPQEILYAISIRGNEDPHQELIRCRLEVKNMFFEPDWGAEDNLNESPVQLDARLHIVGLTPGIDYKILRFDSLANVPKTHFSDCNEKADCLIQFTANAETKVIKLPTMMSNGIYFHRVLKC